MHAHTTGPRTTQELTATVEENEYESALRRLAELCRSAAAGQNVCLVPDGGESPALRYLEEQLSTLLDATTTRILELNRKNIEQETVLKSLGEGLIVVDGEGRLLMMNPQAREMLGQEGKHVRGKLIYDVVRLEHATGTPLAIEERPIMRALKEKETTTLGAGGPVYCYVNAKTGRRYPVTITAAPVIVQGEAQSAVLVFRDSSEEIEMRRVKDEFISLASHQLRTPLSVIGLNLDIISRYHKKAVEGNGLSEQVGEIRKATERMQELVNAVLNVSRIDMGWVDLSIEPVDAGAILADKIKEYSPLIKEKGLTSRFDTPHKKLEVLADRQFLSIVLDNLISNAVKYSECGGVIRVGIDKLATCAVIRVTNSGQGIPAHQQAQVYSKLFRAENAQEAAEAGTGLGLYITKSLVEKMNGSTWFESEQKGETTFYVRLPLV